MTESITSLVFDRCGNWVLMGPCGHDHYAHADIFKGGKCDAFFCGCWKYEPRPMRRVGKWPFRKWVYA